MFSDLTAAIRAVAEGRLDPREALERNLAQAQAPGHRQAFIRLFPQQARAAAEAAWSLRAAGGPTPRLAGLAISVKDLFDVAGQPTTGGSRVLHDAAPARTDAPVVARLRDAGAALIGHTNLTEFAFSGVGINPHHGTPPNPVTAALDPLPRIPGGSTSGGAVSVAVGAAWAALGSDTGGSLRIPAALQGLVGFKGTQRLVPLEGAIPLSVTLDTAGAITRSVRDAVLLHEVLAARPCSLDARPLKALSVAVPRGPLLDNLDSTVARAFERTLSLLSAQGAAVRDVSLPETGPIGLGGFSAAESWAWHRGHLARHADQYDPRVAQRIRRGEAISAADYLDLHSQRRAWISAMERSLGGFDVCLSPTVPVCAPPLEPLIADDTLFFQTNALLLRNPSLVNLLDGCAVSLPMHRPDELPAGLMLWHAAMHDDRILAAALSIESLLASEVRP